MNSIQSDVSFSKGMIGFFFCYKVSIFVALLFNLKGGLYEDASVVFFYVFFLNSSRRFLCSKAMLAFS